MKTRDDLMPGGSGGAAENIEVPQVILGGNLSILCKVQLFLVT